MRVIEYQHRSLPYAHMVVRLANHSDDNDEKSKLKWIDQHTSASYPSDPQSLENEEYCRLIERHMIHECSTAVNGYKNDQFPPCKRGYDCTKITLQSRFDENGYPVYKRRTNDDLRVVPHDRQILLDWQVMQTLNFRQIATVLYIFTTTYLKATRRSSSS